MDTHTFPVSEQDACERLGLTADQLRAFRSDLVEGENYVMSGRRMVLSEVGLMIIAKKFAATEEEAAAVIPEPAKVVELIVHKTAMHGIKNRHVIEAYVPGDDPAVIESMVIVRVRSNENYGRGMRIPGREIAPRLFEHWDTAKNCPAAPPREKGRM